MKTAIATRSRFAKVRDHASADRRLQPDARAGTDGANGSRPTKFHKARQRFLNDLAAALEPRRGRVKRRSFSMHRIRPTTARAKLTTRESPSSTPRRSIRPTSASNSSSRRARRPRISPSSRPTMNSSERPAGARPKRSRPTTFALSSPRSERTRAAPPRRSLSRRPRVSVARMLPPPARRPIGCASSRISTTIPRRSKPSANKQPGSPTKTCVASSVKVDERVVLRSGPCAGWGFGTTGRRPCRWVRMACWVATRW